MLIKYLWKSAVLLASAQATHLFAPFYNAEATTNVDKPNFVYIITDDQDFATANKHIMPHLDKWFASAGTNYTNFYTPINEDREWCFGIQRSSPAQRHKHLFDSEIAPRKASFNPANASGASYVQQLPRLNDTVVEYLDEFYRNCLRSLQAVDELVDAVMRKAEQLGILHNT
ncbi:hypothetical protein NDA16_002021 [Ustilago loliicola]|nr:hypothetical protein NDA16_002021 [Ustilago loliicola]